MLARAGAAHHDGQDREESPRRSRGRYRCRQHACWGRRLRGYHQRGLRGPERPVQGPPGGMAWGCGDDRVGAWSEMMEERGVEGLSKGCFQGPIAQVPEVDISTHIG